MTNTEREALYSKINDASTELFQAGFIAGREYQVTLMSNVNKRTQAINPLPDDACELIDAAWHLLEKASKYKCECSRNDDYCRHCAISVNAYHNLQDAKAACRHKDAQFKQKVEELVEELAKDSIDSLMIPLIHKHLGE
jgi:hypothetical protein